MPDWKVDSDYEFAKKLGDDREWAWEFLRRSNAYREAWEAFKSEIAQWESTFGPSSGWANSADALAELSLWGFDPPLSTAETVKQWEERTFYSVGRKPIKEPLPEWRGRQWRLRRMYDPESTPAHEVRFHRTEPQLWYRFEDIEHVSELVQEFQLGVYTWIDLDRPLVPQLRRLREVLNAKQREVRARGDVHPQRQSNKRDLWPHYLQLLDADNLGIPAKQISESNIQRNYYPKLKMGKQAFDPIAKVNERLKAARTLAEGGYIRLLLDS